MHIRTRPLLVHVGRVQRAPTRDCRLNHFVWPAWRDNTRLPMDRFIVQVSMCCTFKYSIAFFECKDTTFILLYYLFRDSLRLWQFYEFEFYDSMCSMPAGFLRRAEIYSLSCLYRWALRTSKWDRCDYYVHARELYVFSSQLLLIF